MNIFSNRNACSVLYRILFVISLLFFTQLLFTACGGSGSSDGPIDGSGKIGDGGGAPPGDGESSGGGAPSGGGSPGGTVPDGFIPGSGTGAGSGDGTQAGTLTAGDIDDNLNFTAFENYISTVLQADTNHIFPDFHLTDRVIIRVVDMNGDGVANAQLSFSDTLASPLFETTANSNGDYYLFPTLDPIGENRIITLSVTPPGLDTPSIEVSINLDDLNADRTVDITLADWTRMLPDTLDLMFVIDATGSMSDELEFLKAEFQSIIENIQTAYSGVAMRFGLVVYRDIGDTYVTKSFAFTDSVTEMKAQLSAQSASGGGDYPEAMEQAMGEALKAQWRSGTTAKVLFLVADAPPHDKNITATFTEALSAREKGIQIFPLAASGVADVAEALMRVMAVVTHSRYSFLTDDSGVGNIHAEPKIPCYVVTRLDQLMMRIISGVLSGARVEPVTDDIIRTVGSYNEGVCGEVIP